MGHATMENRHGLAVAGRVTHANGTAERRASETILKARRKAAGRRITVGEDKAYDTADHVANLRAIGLTPHVTQNRAVTKAGKTRNSAIDERTTWHPGYGMSQSRGAMFECIFGWCKQHGTMRKTKHRGIVRVAADFLLNLIAYNLIRIPKLLAAQPPRVRGHQHKARKLHPAPPRRPKPNRHEYRNSPIQGFSADC